MSGRRGDWMVTASGVAYYPLDPWVWDVRPGDIAQSLSRICRYLGHCTRFYSVAEHSVLVSLVVPRRAAFAGLMHDAAEAYVCDIHRPLKRALSNYGDIEALNWAVVTARFGLYQHVELVKSADDAVLMAEKNAIVPRSDRPWSVHAEPALVPIFCWGHETARLMFLQRLHEVSDGEHGYGSVRGWLALAVTKLGIAFKRYRNGR